MPGFRVRHQLQGLPSLTPCLLGAQSSTPELGGGTFCLLILDSAFSPLRRIKTSTSDHREGKSLRYRSTAVLFLRTHMNSKECLVVQSKAQAENRRKPVTSGPSLWGRRSKAVRMNRVVFIKHVPQRIKTQTARPLGITRSKRWRDVCVCEMN